MARSQLRFNVHDGTGRVVQNARINVFQKGTTSPVLDLYTTEVGGSPVSTLTSDGQGDAIGWMETPKAVDLNVTDNTDTAFFADTPAVPISFASFTETVTVNSNPTDVATLNTEQTITAKKVFQGQFVSKDPFLWVDPTAPPWNAAFDGTTDDTAAIQAAIDSVGDTSKLRALRLNWPGRAAISDTILFKRKAVHIVGRGLGNATLSGHSVGSAVIDIGVGITKAMFQFEEVWYTWIDSLKFTGRITAKPLAAMRWYQITGANPVNIFQRVENCWIGQMSGYEPLAGQGRQFQYGILVDGQNPSPDLNPNNDQSWFVRNTFMSCDVGMAFNSSQNVLNHVQDCQFYFGGTGIQSRAQNNVTNCLFSSMIDGADFDLDSSGAVFGYGVVSEGGRQQAIMRATNTLLLIGGYFAFNNALKADGRLIDATNNTGNPARIELYHHSYRDIGYTNPVTPNIAARSNGSAVHRSVGLHFVSLGNSAVLGPANLDVVPVGAGTTLLYGEGYPSGPEWAQTQSFYNHLVPGGTVDLTRDDRMALGLTGLKVKAGPLTDADFAHPRDGQVGFDSTNNKLMVRKAGAWISSGVFA